MLLEDLKGDTRSNRFPRVWYSEWLPRAGDTVDVAGGGAVDGEGAGVEVGAADDVEAVTDGDGGEVAEGVDVGVAGHGREAPPAERLRVEEVGVGDARVLREDAEEVGEAPVGAAGGD